MLNSDCKLNNGFESYIKEIAECLENGDDDWAKFLSEELVRDYGTHYVKKAHIGGKLCVFNSDFTNVLIKIEDFRFNYRKTPFSVPGATYVFCFTFF